MVSVDKASRKLPVVRALSAVFVCGVVAVSPLSIPKATGYYDSSSDGPVLTASPIVGPAGTVEGVVQAQGSATHG